MSYAKKQILQVINDKGSITAKEVTTMINRERTTSLKLLNNLIDKTLIVWNGTSKFDTHGKYIMK